MLLLGWLPAGGSEWAAVLSAYLLGSVPFGLLLGRIFRGVDIRESGSRNIGATNAGRVLGRPFGLLAFALDFGKGWFSSAVLAPALAASDENPWTLAVLCAGAAVVGHVWPLYLRFRGGKAVATTSGAIVGIDPLVFLAGGLAWLVTLAVTRFVGLSSMVMAVVFPLAAWWRMDARGYGIEVVVGLSVLTVLILARHRANMGRMLAGTEPRIGRKTAAGEETPEEESG